MKEKTFEKILSSLPVAIRSELVRLASGRGGVKAVSELKLRAVGVSSFVISGERVRLFAKVSLKELEKTLEILSDGAIYAKRDTLIHGYISPGDGVRVGVSGFARYNGGALVGISEVTSLVFRIPTGSFDARKELLEVFSSCKRGALIYAPPGRGKTSALRALASDLGERGEEVCVIDERCEFVESELALASVDLLRGYKRADGIEIALRTLAPSVIALDEVGRLGEAEAMLEALSSGVKVALTAHASSVDEVIRRPALRPFLDLGIIDVLVGIDIEDGKRVLSVSEAV